MHNIYIDPLNTVIAWECIAYMYAYMNTHDISVITSPSYWFYPSNYNNMLTPFLIQTCLSFSFFLNTFQITESGLDQIQLLKPLQLHILRCLSIDLSCFSESCRNVRVILHRGKIRFPRTEKAAEYLQWDLFPPDIFSFQCYWSAQHELMTYKI